MAEQRNRWNWEIPGFEPRKTAAREDQSPPVQSLVRRYSIAAPVGQRADPSRAGVAAKVQKLKEQVKRAKNNYLELKQEASDLQEYSNAKLERVTRYLGVLAERARKLDLAALETEAKVAPLINEKKRLFNKLLTAKGNIKVFCRARPLFEDEGSSVVEFPDEYTVRVTTGDDSIANPKKDFQFDRVYGPHVSQGELFLDIQPFVQSALDGYNVSLFAYGQAYSGKTHTMEGSINDRGLYMRCFEELYDLSNLDSTSASRYKFYVTAFELYNEQAQDLLLHAESDLPKTQMGTPDYYVELGQAKVENPLEFSRVLKSAMLRRGTERSRCRTSHLIITVHIYYNNWITKENAHSKLSLIDLAGSDVILEEDASGDCVTDVLHVMKSLSALGDVLSSLSSKKDIIPFENSVLTKLLADSLGGNAKCLMIVSICPNKLNVRETVSSLNFSSRACNAELSLGNRDTIKKWRDVANDTRKELYEREKEIHDLKQEVLGLKQALKESNDQCSLLASEVQKTRKVSSIPQTDLKAENELLAEKQKIEKEQNAHLRNQVAHLLQLEQEQLVQIQERDSNIQTLQEKIKNLEKQLNDAMHASDAKSIHGFERGSNGLLSTPKSSGDNADPLTVTKKLEEELLKRDALIQRLHEENERLFNRLTEKASVTGSTQVSSPSSREPVSQQSQDVDRSSSGKGNSAESLLLTWPPDRTDNYSNALVKSGPEKSNSTPAGEYLTGALMEFDPDQYDSPATVADGANKLLMLVLAAVIKAGAAREHEILAEIRDAVFSFIRRMEPRKVMDTMLVSRVRILYIRSLLARSPELQSIKVFSVGRFLEKGGRSRSSSRGSSPGRSPTRYDSGSRNALVEEHYVHGFKVKIKQEKKSKFSSIVLKLRGVEEESWKQHVTGGKLREITDEAKSFAIGNKALAALFVHTPAGELQRQIRSWLAENFEFLCVTGADAIGGVTGQLELLSTAIMDGWMAGLGAAVSPSTDALGQLLSEYAKRVYTSQLQHLKDIAGTLATEEAEDLAQVHKLRSALESVDHKRRKILQQMKSDVALLTVEQGGSPIHNPTTSAEDARLASLISLDGILKQAKDIIKQTSLSSVGKTKKRALLASLDELFERMPSLLDIDHPCAQRQIEEARAIIEVVPDLDDQTVEDSRPTSSGNDWVSTQEIEVSQWNVLQFNTGSTSPFIVKCGANSNSELVIKADAKVQDPKGGEIIRVAPRPSVLNDMNLEEIKQVFSQLPEALSVLSVAKTADGTRARYSRLYRTLAMKVPSLKHLVNELEKGGALKDTRS